MTKPCEVCGSSFEAVRSTHRFCSGRCRQRRHRSTPPRELALDLIASVRSALEACGVVDTVEGQLALVLAAHAVEGGSVGVAGLARELRVAMTGALEIAAERRAKQLRVDR